MSPCGWALRSPRWDPETQSTPEWCRSDFTGCWSWKRFHCWSLLFIFSLCLSQQQLCKRNANKKVKWPSDGKWQDEFIETSVFQEVLSKPCKEFSNLHCSWCYSARRLLSSGTLYAKLAQILCPVVFTPLWFMTGGAPTASPLMVLRKAGSCPVSGVKSKWCRKQATDWGFASSSLKPSCLLENFKCWVESCLAWACFWVLGIQLWEPELGCRYV